MQAVLTAAERPAEASMANAMSHATCVNNAQQNSDLLRVEP